MIQIFFISFFFTHRLSIVFFLFPLSFAVISFYTLHLNYVKRVLPQNPPLRNKKKKMQNDKKDGRYSANTLKTVFIVYLICFYFIANRFSTIVTKDCCKMPLTLAYLHKMKRFFRGYRSPESCKSNI